jgi:hypothetical protein
MAWHHIIPFPLLRDVWNRLVDQHIATELPDARTAIRQYIVLSDRNHSNLDALIEKIRVENIDQRRTSHYHLQPLTSSEWQQLTTPVVWPPWNTVEGPQRRSDDPHDSFDRFTVGLTAEESARMRAVETLFHDFQRFVDMVPGAASLRALIQAVGIARHSVCCDLPIPFRPEMWIEDSGCLWRKRRAGEQYSVAGN